MHVDNMKAYLDLVGNIIAIFRNLKYWFIWFSSVYRPVKQNYIPHINSNSVTANSHDISIKRVRFHIILMFTLNLKVERTREPSLSTYHTSWKHPVYKFRSCYTRNDISINCVCAQISMMHSVKLRIGWQTASGLLQKKYKNAGASGHAHFSVSATGRGSATMHKPQKRPNTDRRLE